VATILVISRKSTDQNASPGGGATTLGGETPNTGCGTLFQSVPAGFNQ